MGNNFQWDGGRENKSGMKLILFAVIIIVVVISLFLVFNQQPAPIESPTTVRATASEIVSLSAETFSFSGPPWVVSFRNGTNSTEFMPKETDEAVLSNDDDGDVYTWENLNTSAGNLTVKLTKHQEGVNKIRFQVSAELIPSGDLTLEQVLVSANIASKNPGDPDTQAVMVPTFVGGITTYNPYENSKGGTSQYPVWQFPYILLYNERNPDQPGPDPGVNEGISFRIEDPDGKSLVLTTGKVDDGFRIGQGSRIPFKGNSITGPPVVVELYQGSGYEGSILYRHWVDKQPWVSTVPPIEDNEMIPQGLKDAPFMIFLGTADNEYNPDFFKKMFEYYNDLAGGSVASIYFEYGLNDSFVPEGYATRKPGLSGVIKEAREMGIVTIAYQGLDSHTTFTKSGIGWADMAVDCDGRYIGSGEEPVNYGIELHSSGASILEENLVSQLQIKNWGSDIFDMLYFDHLNPMTHETCWEISGIPNPDGTEGIGGMTKFMESAASKNPHGYGFASEVLIDRFLQWIPMSAAADGDECGTGDRNFPHISAVHSGRSLRTAGLTSHFAVDMNRAYVENLYNMISLGKMPFLLDWQDLPDKQFFTVQVVPSLEKALNESSRMYPAWKKFVRFGQRLQDLEGASSPTVSRDALGHGPLGDGVTCNRIKHPLVLHGVFKYEKSGELGIVLLNWNDPDAPVASSASKEDESVLKQGSSLFIGIFDPYAYGIPVDGSYSLYKYRKASERFEELFNITGPVTIRHDVKALSGELFVIKKN